MGFTEQWKKRVPADFRAPLATALMVGVGSMSVPLGKKIMEGGRSLLGTHDPAFTAILKMHPDLENHKDLAHKYYKSMRHFSPFYANEPLAAGALIKNMITKFHEDIGGPPYPVVQSIAGIKPETNDSVIGKAMTNAVEQGVKMYEPGEIKKLRKDLEEKETQSRYSQTRQKLLDAITRKKETISDVEKADLKHQINELHSRQ